MSRVNISIQNNCLLMSLFLSVLLPLLGGLFNGPLLCGAVDYYVTPTVSSHPDCPIGEPCYTINHYASNDSYFSGKENITLNFLQGTHNLTYNIGIYRDTQSLTMRGFKTGGGSTFSIAEIYFTSTQIYLREIVDMTIENLIIHGGLIQNSISQADQFKIVVQDVTLYESNITLLYVRFAKGSILVSESVQYSSQFTFWLDYDTDVNVTIENSMFYSKPDLTLVTLETATTTNFTLQIDNVSTLHLHDEPASQDPPFYDLYISSALGYARVSHASVSITNSNFSRSSSTGIFIDKPLATDLRLAIVNTTISNHRQGAFVLDLGSIYTQNLQMTIDNCRIANNYLGNVNRNTKQLWLREPGGAGITLYGDAHPFINGTAADTNFEITISKTIFNGNHDLHGKPITNWLYRIPNVTIVDCEFQDNKGTPIVAYYSDFTLSGNVTFIGNTANQGGAIALTSSHMSITKNTSVVFENNSVTDVGGAIFVEQSNVYLDNDPTTTSQCFYQLPDWDFDVIPTGYYYLEFYNNTAEHGGDHLYGASLKSYCTVYIDKSGGPYGYKRSGEVDYIFHFIPNITESSSSISSIPTRVCLCDSNSQQHDCANVSTIFVTVSVYPGELFTMSAVIVGSHFGSTSGSVNAQFLSHSQNHTVSSALRPNEYTQGVRDHKQCTPLQYSVYSACDHEVIILTAEGGTVGLYGDRDALEHDIQEYNALGIIPPSLLTTPVYINITLLPCPTGFNLTGDPPGCECYSVFGANHISCDVTSGCVIRSGTQFVAAVFDGNETTGVIVHNHCPFGYCKPQQVTVDLNTPDSQCAFNRSGTLCGECKEGYSVAIGSSQCLQCDNRYLALLLFFAVAGILLVLFIKVLNLTVTQGTINGLIFYANIVWANQSILYPDQEHDNGASIFFKTFIAWLNLDFGIETCFIQGLNGYWKTWLQFVFPFYIWAIAGVIILVSRHSSLVTKLFGNTAVPMLATLFLLSYSKLLRTIITAMSMTFLVEYPSGYKSTVWSFDGNLQFCGIPHVFLFTAALASLLILWLPYTSVLLSVQWLQIGSEHKVLKWVDKLKPVFDAYFAPFKDKHRYWVGVLLLVRGVLLITFALTSANMPTANLLALVTVAASLLAYTALTGHLYKKSYVSLLDTVSLLNLAILGGGALYTDLAGGNRAALVFTSVGVAFVQLVGIVVFHSWALVKRCRKDKQKKDYEDLSKVRAREYARQLEYSQNGIRVVDYSKLREPLLEDSGESAT